MPEVEVFSETAETLRRKRLRFRCWHRGSREADLLLGRFADRHLESMRGAELDGFDALLDEPDPDIWDWVVRGVPAPAHLDAALIDRLRAAAAASFESK
jgi:antitoxin CptB